jgi:cobalt-zinc-cadmium efflux system outer membrane protein
MNTRLLCVGLASASLVLAGCAAIPADRGSSLSSSLVQSHSSLGTELQLAGGNDQQAQSLLTEPLDADAAVKLALLKNPRMQGLYAELGLAQAEVYDASRLSNPNLGYIRLTPDASSEQARTTWSLTQSFTELLFLHYRTRVTRSQLLQAQQRVAHDVLNLEADVRIAYYRYVAAALVAQLHEQITLATTASRDYAKSLFDAGNISELQLTREQAYASDARIALRAAHSEALHAKAELLTLVGVQLDASQPAVRFVERLDVPLQLQLDAAQLRKWADEQRVDLAAVREQINLLSSVKTHSSHWRWLGGVQLQAEHERETDGTTLRGLGGSIDVPLFNQGGGSVLRARAQLEAAQADVDALQLSIANTITAQIGMLDNAWQRVDEYRQRLVPLREHIIELSQQQQTFMLIGAFETLTAKHEALSTYQSYLNIVGDYWVQYAELARTAGGRLPDSTNAVAAGVSVGVEALEPTSDSNSSSDMKGMDMSKDHAMSSMDHSPMDHRRPPPGEQP